MNKYLEQTIENDAVNRLLQHLLGIYIVNTILAVTERQNIFPTLFLRAITKLSFPDCDNRHHNDGNSISLALAEL